MVRLNLTNYDDHPSDNRYMVFHFKDPKMAGEFMDGLTMAAIPFEADEDGGPPYLIGVKRSFRQKALEINYSVIGRHRQKFIGDSIFRWFVIALVSLAILLAVLGAFNRS
jgi:hypothetical protein